MTSSQGNPSAERRTRSIIVVALVLVGAALISVKVSPFDSAFGADTADSSTRSTAIEITPDAPDVIERRAAPASVGTTGRVQGRATVFDSDVPAVANLEPDLRRALQRAASDAGDEITFEVNSGWRSAKHQEQLLREAVDRYGSTKEAARWVAPPEKSAHVSGDAVDIGPTSAAAWLADHGADYGLCRTYRNEPWHFELRPDAIANGCPAMYADPTEDPRLQQ